MRVSIFLGNGDGTFQPQLDQLKFLLSNPSAIADADLNGDGNIDLAVNDQNNNIADAIAVLPGKGDGTFPQKLGYRSGVIGAGDNPCSIAIADFNGDQKWDIANCNNGGNSVTVVLGNGDETFSYTRAWGTGDGPRAVAVGDFNGGMGRKILSQLMRSTIPSAFSWGMATVPFIAGRMRTGSRERFPQPRTSMEMARLICSRVVVFIAR